MKEFKTLSENELADVKGGDLWGYVVGGFIGAYASAIPDIAKGIVKGAHAAARNGRG